MSVLHKKLLRDLRRLKGQVATISIVLGLGIMAVVMVENTYASLVATRDEYYRVQRFADVFAHLERAPRSLAGRLESLPGVETVYPRIVADVMLPLDNQPDPVSGRLVSIPDRGEPPLNGLHLESGRMPDPAAAGEVLLLDQFAKAHHLTPGDRLPVVIDGSLRKLTIVGIAMSPEYLFAMSGREAIADPRRFAVIWMREHWTATAFRMEGAFNDLAISIQPGTAAEAVISELERELEPYGGSRAVGRDRQPSNHALSGELAQLATWALLTPIIFFSVAAFLVNIVLSRLVLLERTQIAVLKALGISDRRVGAHYLALVALIVAIGSIIGVLLGVWSGSWMVGMYEGFFHFPSAEFRLSAGTVILATAAAFVVAAGGALTSIIRVAVLPPAEALRPPAPLAFRRTFLSRIGLASWIGPAMTMLARGVIRTPLRFVLSTSGIAMGVGIYIFGSFMWPSFDFLMKEAYPREHRDDLEVLFVRPLPEGAVRELEHLSGVVFAEGVRAAAVRVRSGVVWRDTAIIGLDEKSELRHVFHRFEREVVPPDEGVILNARLAEILGVRAGDELEMELREGAYPKRRVVVAGLVEEPFGLLIYAQRRTIDRLLREEPRITSAVLRIEAGRTDDVRAQLKKMPAVLSAVAARDVIRAYEKQTGQSIGVITMIMALSAAAIAAGIVYNNARIVLSMRGRDLASLSVLGLRRGEISQIMLGELAVQVVLGIPLGMLFGRWWAGLFAFLADSELVRIPVLVTDRVYATAALIAVVACIASAWFVQRRLDELDLIGVLKSAE